VEDNNNKLFYVCHMRT